jgi:hypothetical protein
MSINVSTEFLFGLVCGILLTILSRALMSMFQRGMRALPLLLLIGVLCLLLYLLDCIGNKRI